MRNNDLTFYEPLIGEYAWYSIINSAGDSDIDRVSNEHYNQILDLVGKPRYFRNIKGLKILEVASYAHITGYMLSECGASVTLFDISANNLELGRKAAGTLAKQNVTRVAGDYHNLPFEDGTFDLVYVFSAFLQLIV